MSSANLEENLRKLVITVHEKKIPFKNFIKIYGIDSILLLLDKDKMINTKETVLVLNTLFKWILTQKNVHHLIKIFAKDIRINLIDEEIPSIAISENYLIAFNCWSRSNENYRKYNIFNEYKEDKPLDMEVDSFNNDKLLNESTDKFSKILPTSNYEIISDDKLWMDFNFDF